MSLTTNHIFPIWSLKGIYIRVLTLIVAYLYTIIAYSFAVYSSIIIKPTRGQFLFFKFGSS